MMANLMPGEFDYLTRDAERKRKFADALRQQQQPQGQMVGGTFVAPSITQHLASLFNTYQGAKMGEEADRMERQAYESQRQKYSTAAERLAQAMQGSPEVIGNNTDDAAFMNAPGTVQPSRPATTQDMLRAQVQYAQDIGDPNAMTAAVQGLANYGIRQQDREDERGFRNQTREDEQAFRAEQALLQREAQANALKEQIAARQQAGMDSANLRRELAQMQMQNARDMAQFSVANRQPQAPVAVMGPDGKPVYVQPSQAYGRQPYSAKQAGGALNSTAQKELFEADEIAQASQNALGMLNEALTLNKQAYSGIGAKPRAILRSNLPGQSAAADATINLDNLMTGQALESLKATFGAVPTEGERKILLDIQASADKTPAQRESILNRAIQAANKRLAFSKNKSQALRTGSYFTEGVPIIENPTQGNQSGWSIKRKQ